MEGGRGLSRAPVEVGEKLILVRPAAAGTAAGRSGTATGAHSAHSGRTDGGAHLAILFALNRPLLRALLSPDLLHLLLRRAHLRARARPLLSGFTGLHALPAVRPLGLAHSCLLRPALGLKIANAIARPDAILLEQSVLILLVNSELVAIPLLRRCRDSRV
jgi:hypothetical protein